MQDSPQYRIVNRKIFAVVMVVLLGFVAVGVWVGLDHLEDYTDQLEELAVTDPAEAAATVTQLTQTLAILNGLVLGSLTLLIIWHGLSLGDTVAGAASRGAYMPGHQMSEPSCAYVSMEST